MENDELVSLRNPEWWKYLSNSINERGVRVSRFGVDSLLYITFRYASRGDLEIPAALQPVFESLCRLGVPVTLGMVKQMIAEVGRVD